MYTDYIGVVYGSRSVYLAYTGVQLYFYVRIHTACATGLLAKMFTDCIYPPKDVYWVYIYPSEDVYRIYIYIYISI